MNNHNFGERCTKHLFDYPPAVAYKNRSLFLIQGRSFPHVIPAGCGTAEEVFSLMMRIAAEKTLDSPASRLRFRTHLKTILAVLTKHYSSHPLTTASTAATRQNTRRLRAVFDYIENHCSERITVCAAASRVSMSGAHFMRFFKRATRQPLLAYLNQYRITKAQSLLATTGRPISEISQEVGFYDQSHFGMVFRRLMRTTPRRYRLEAVKRQCVQIPECQNQVRTS